jgi:formylglycine-generating enzyme required for sulfatase activity
MTETRKLRVFLCHASQDKPIVRELYQRLLSESWIDPWLDAKKLLPGQNWQEEIEATLDAADNVIIFLSKTSVNKEGFVQKELRYAKEIALEKPEGTIFLVPVRLEECEIPRGLRSIHYVDYFGEKKNQSYNDLLDALKIRLDEKTRKEAGGQMPRSEDLGVYRPGVEEKTYRASAALDLYIPADYAGSAYVPPPATVQTWTFGGIEFVIVPHGEFLMGSNDKDKGVSDDEKPQHKLNIPYDFLLARFPITNEQFSVFAKEKKLKGWGASDWQDKPNHPAVNVSWKTAQDYCVWLNEKFGKQLQRGLVFRLPTEAEWEKAARWKPSPAGRGQGEGEALIYPWGNEFDAAKCNTNESGRNNTSPVGAFSPQGDSPYGCADMAGNVWEWTASLWGDDASNPSYKYPYNPRDGRENNKAVKDVRRVLRGGSFGGDEGYARCAFRYGGYLGSFRNSIGFRVAASPSLL